jgi:histidinol-phosphate aminotransferase
VVERVRESFNVNCMGLAAAEAALAMSSTCSGAWRATRKSARARPMRLRARGWFVHPSQTNFLLVEFGARTAAIEAGLLDRGVIPRPMGGYGLPDCLRITVGDRDENPPVPGHLDAIA